VAAVILRNKLIDYQKKKRALKHGGGAVHVELDANVGVERPADVDFIAIHRAIDRLRSVHERRAQVVDLRFWLGMKNEEIADALGISLATVKTDWTIAKAFLHRELEGREAGDVDA
jgi:RNA polymerase sigma factor (sigma-70 family)